MLDTTPLELSGRITSGRPGSSSTIMRNNDISLEAVRHAYVLIFTHMEVYLAPNGTCISMVPAPDGSGETLGVPWNVHTRLK